MGITQYSFYATEVPEIPAQNLNNRNVVVIPVARSMNWKVPQNILMQIGIISNYGNNIHTLNAS